MPHDAKGNLLKVGDRIVLRGTILNIMPSEDYCNCTIELDYTMPPDNQKSMVSSINTKQLLLDVAEAASAGSD